MLMQIASVRILDFEKRHDLDESKFYTFVVQVTRAGGASALVFRRFRFVCVCALKLVNFPSRSCTCMYA
jgi:hypothetical protein